MNNDLNELVHIAGIQIEKDESLLLIRPKFSFSTKTNVGSLLISLAFLTSAIYFFSNMDHWILVVLGVFYSCMFFLNTIMIFEEFTNFIKVSSTEIQFRNGHKKHLIPLHESFTVKMTSETKYVNSLPGTLGSHWHIVELFLIQGDTKYDLLKFQAEAKYSGNLNRLGGKIISMIHNRKNESRRVY